MEMNNNNNNNNNNSYSLTTVTRDIIIIIITDSTPITGKPLMITPSVTMTTSQRGELSYTCTCTCTCICICNTCIHVICYYIRPRPCINDIITNC